MNKALEMVRTMINGANEYEKKTGDKNPPVYFSKDNLLIIEEALKRLEAINNANPSEALECLEKLATHRIEYREAFEFGFTKTMPFKSTIEFTTIKQALLKAQEHNSTNIFKGSKEVKIEIPESSLMDYNPVKQYLKWEDLEELDKLLKIVTTCKELSKQLGFPLPLFKKVLDSGIWVKDKDRFYHLDTLEINVKIEDDGFVIEELYFEDLDGVMDTTGFKVYSQDYKKTWFLKEDRSE